MPSLVLHADMKVVSIAEKFERERESINILTFANKKHFIDLYADVIFSVNIHVIVIIA